MSVLYPLFCSSLVCSAIFLRVATTLVVAAGYEDDICGDQLPKLLQKAKEQLLRNTQWFLRLAHRSPISATRLDA